MRVVVYDFTPIADALMGELTMMSFTCVTYEDLIDLTLQNRYPLGSTEYTDYMVDMLADYRGVETCDRHLVKSAYYRVSKLVDALFPIEHGRWLCCGFVQKQGYFIHSAEDKEMEMHNLRLMVLKSIRPLRGYYDSHITHSGV